MTLADELNIAERTPDFFALKLGIVSFVVLNVLDVILSLYSFNLPPANGLLQYEFNPVAAALLNHNLWLALNYKLLTVILASGILWYLRRREKAALAMTYGLCGFYVCMLFYGALMTAQQLGLLN